MASAPPLLFAASYDRLAAREAGFSAANDQELAAQEEFPTDNNQQATSDSAARALHTLRDAVREMPDAVETLMAVEHELQGEVTDVQDVVDVHPYAKPRCKARYWMIRRHGRTKSLQLESISLCLRGKRLL
jgi:hypothetical protein